MGSLYTFGSEKKTSKILSIFWLTCIAQANKALFQKHYKTQENFKTKEILQSVGYEVLLSRFARNLDQFT